MVFQEIPMFGGISCVYFMMTPKLTIFGVGHALTVVAKPC
jgi:hypothetical protein